MRFWLIRWEAGGGTGGRWIKGVKHMGWGWDARGLRPCVSGNDGSPVGYSRFTHAIGNVDL